MVINLIYNKRKIINPDEENEKVSIVDTKLWGQRDIGHYLQQIKNDTSSKVKD